MNEKRTSPKRLARLATLAGGGTAAAGVALTAAITLGVAHAATTTTNGPTSGTVTSPSRAGTVGPGSDSTSGLSAAPQNQGSDAGSNGS